MKENVVLSLSVGPTEGLKQENIFYKVEKPVVKIWFYFRPLECDSIVLRGVFTRDVIRCDRIGILWKDSWAKHTTHNTCSTACNFYLYAATFLLTFWVCSALGFLSSVVKAGAIERILLYPREWKTLPFVRRLRALIMPERNSFNFVTLMFFKWK